MAARTPIPDDVQVRVLTWSRRRCCLCYFLDDKDEVASGQIAHVDRNASHSAFDNLAYLCLAHHDKYDSKSSQSKGLLPGELRSYRDRLYQQYGVAAHSRRLLGILTDDLVPLSTCLPSLLEFARANGAEELERVVQCYLVGYKIEGSELDLDSMPEHVKARAIRFLVARDGSTVNLEVLRFGFVSPVNLIHSLSRDTKIWVPRYVMFPMSINEFEHEARNAVSDGILTFPFRVGSLATNAKDPDRVLMGYALSRAYADVLIAVRTDLIRRLVSLSA